MANVIGVVEDSENFPLLLHGSPCVLTGDVGRMDEQGTLHFLGRGDLKVKVKMSSRHTYPTQPHANDVYLPLSYLQSANLWYVLA